MKITPKDGLTTFFVQSDVNPNREPYSVDLEPFDGSGWCDCDHFKFRMQPELMLGKRAKSDPSKYQCKHIVACREFLGKELVDTVTRTAINQDKQT